ncbi:Nramp family divalent metal transporter [Croceitalea marina]|uniref:Nramp family divalent metal transporter n=1 Tax=Croceitalea marina TaxID=1775166 RepID=A0ABW5MUF7_9FLAO
MFKKIGPGVLIAAAFIGPGTITACSIAGVGFGYALLWAMFLSILATMALQEMAARLGVVSQKGLALVIREQLKSKWIRIAVLMIIIGAILIGNTAYEAGNIGGATLGMTALFGNKYSVYYPFIVGFLAFALLWMGSYKVLEKVFVGLIFLMSLSFIVTAIITQPDVSLILKGLFLPTFPEEGLLTIIALVGTTVVPYNLFLHASLVNEKWKSKDDLRSVRWDTIVSIATGGFISMTIIIAAAAIPSKEIVGALDLAKGLEPLFGNAARYFMGVGLFAAGITSAITAPLAAAYVANNCFGWNADLKDWKFRLVWILILGVGVLSLSLKIRPIEIIQFAQIANGALLPVIAILLVWIVNKNEVMGKYRNSFIHNIIGFTIIVLSIFLGAKSIFKVFDLF